MYIVHLQQVKLALFPDCLTTQFLTARRGVGLIMGITFLGIHVDRQGEGRGPDRMLVFFVFLACVTQIFEL